MENFKKTLSNALFDTFLTQVISTLTYLDESFYKFEFIKKNFPFYDTISLFHFINLTKQKSFINQLVLYFFPNFKYVFIILINFKFSTNIAFLDPKTIILSGIGWTGGVNVPPSNSLNVSPQQSSPAISQKNVVNKNVSQKKQAAKAQKLARQKKKENAIKEKEIASQKKTLEIQRQQIQNFNVFTNLPPGWRQNSVSIPSTRNNDLRGYTCYMSPDKLFWIDVGNCGP